MSDSPKIKYAFRDNEYCVPVPQPHKNELLLEIDEYAELEAKEKSTRFNFSHPYRKLLFFMFREGIKLTVDKVKSSRLQRSLEEYKKVVFAVGSCNNKQAVAIGPMDCPGISKYCFHYKYVSEIPDNRDVKWCLARVASYLRKNSNFMEELCNYSPFSGIEPSIELESILHDQGQEEMQIDLPPMVSSSSSKCDKTPALQKSRSEYDLFLAGAGAYAWAYIMPALKGLNNNTVIDLNPLLAGLMAKKFGFENSHTSCERAFQSLRDCKEPVVVIATYHSTHVELAELAYEINPQSKIFIEKPPAVNYEQLERLVKLKASGAHIEVGYNRRHAPLSIYAREALSKEKGPIHMVCLVKELSIPENHWYYWPNQGTRVVGNLCHWTDLADFIIGHEPVSIEASSAPGHPAGDEVTAVVDYSDGSKLTIVATDRGNSLRGVQEYIDLRRGDTTVTIDDYTRLTEMESGKKRVFHKRIRDKGHIKMYHHFMMNLKNKRKSEFIGSDLYNSTSCYLDVVSSIQRGLK